MCSVFKVIFIYLILLVNEHNIVCMFVTEFVIDAEEEKHIAAVQKAMGLSMVLVGSQWFSMVIIGSQWFSKVLNGYRRFPVVIIGSQWFP